MNDSGNVDSGGSHPANGWISDASAQARIAGVLAEQARAARLTLQRQRRETTSNTAAIDKGLQLAGDMQTRLIRKSRVALVKSRLQLSYMSIVARVRLRVIIVLTALAGLVWFAFRVALVIGAIGAAIYALFLIVRSALANMGGPGW